VRTRIWIGGAALAVLVACFPTGVCGCSEPYYSGVVVGFVRDNAGSPTSATVRASVRDKFCQAVAPVRAYVAFPDSSVAVTDSVGRYRFDFWNSRPDTVCVRLVARRIGLADSSVRDSLKIPLVVEGDTLRADFSLP